MLKTPLFAAKRAALSAPVSSRVHYEEARPRSDLASSLAIAAVALVARLAVVAWAASRFPPIDDGVIYLRIAERMATGLGYTCAWPDGWVTPCAFYPVGYPAMAAAVFALVGTRIGGVMVLNALIGALGAFAAHRLALRVCRSPTERCATPNSSPHVRDRRALAAGLLVALHPALVACAPVVMTDAIVAALVTCAAAVAAWARDRTGAGRGFVVGLVIGVAALVRPQSLVLAPVFGLLASLGPRATARRVATTIASASLAALLVCAPWTARNCMRMSSCVLVSTNGGWNLIVGTVPGSSPFVFPEACHGVYDEVEKDACMGREARRIIRERPAAWLALAPGKLAGTFDYIGYAPWYLHNSNPAAFPRGAKIALGVAETVLTRLALLGALAWAARRVSKDEPRGLRFARLGVAAAGAIFAVTLHAWIGYAAFAIAALLRGRALWRGPVLGGAMVTSLVATMATHAIFFGLGRYAIVVLPLLTALAPMAFGEESAPRDA